MVDFNAVHDAIREAESATAILQSVHDFLDGLSPEERSQLPWGLNAAAVQTAADIAMWALHLRDGEHVPSFGPAYGRATKVFSEAAIRLVAMNEVVGPRE